MPNNQLFYPSTKELFKQKRMNYGKSNACPVITCKQGMVKDAKTLRLRDCTVCLGEGVLKKI